MPKAKEENAARPPSEDVQDQNVVRVIYKGHIIVEFHGERAVTGALMLATLFVGVVACSLLI